jgi:hypothetical protein
VDSVDVISVVISLPGVALHCASTQYGMVLSGQSALLRQTVGPPHPGEATSQANSERTERANKRGAGRCIAECESIISVLCFAWCVSCCLFVSYCINRTVV